MEKRDVTRVKLKADVTLEVNGFRYSGEIDSISLKGVFVRTSMTIPISEAVHLTMNTYPYSSIELDAWVVRSDETGVGLEINRMTVESFVKLRDLIMHQATDPDVVMNEVYSVVSCIV